MKNIRVVAILLSIGVMALTSACAGKPKSAEGPAATKSAEQKAAPESKEAPPSAESPAGGEPPAPPAVTGEPSSASAPSGEAIPASTPSEPAVAEAAPAPQPAAAEPSKTSEGPKGADLSTFEIVHFEFDKYDILPEYRDGLAKEAETLKNSGVKIVIEGHCDERGTEEYNLALGDRRANAVKKYWESLGVDDGQLGTISYGEERPVDPGHNENAWRLNRRAQFIPAE